MLGPHSIGVLNCGSRSGKQSCAEGALESSTGGRPPFPAGCHSTSSPSNLKSKKTKPKISRQKSLCLSHSFCLSHSSMCGKERGYSSGHSKYLRNINKRWRMSSASARKPEHKPQRHWQQRNAEQQAENAGQNERNRAHDDAKRERAIRSVRLNRA